MRIHSRGDDFFFFLQNGRNIKYAQCKKAVRVLFPNGFDTLIHEETRMGSR